MLIFRNDLHNAFSAAVETGDVHVFLQLTHFLVHLNSDVDVRVRRVFPQIRFDAEL